MSSFWLSSNAIITGGGVRNTTRCGERMRTAERALRAAQPPDLLQGVVVVGARARVWLDRQRDYALMADNDLTCDV